MPALARDLLLLALDDDTGELLVHKQRFRYAMAGALLAELVLGGFAKVESGCLVLTGEAPSDPVLADAVQQLDRAWMEWSLRAWIPHFAGRMRRVEEALVDALVADGTLRREEDRVLLVFRRRRLPEVDGSLEDTVRARVREAVRTGEADAHTAALLSLLRVCRLLDEVFDEAELKLHAARIDAITEQVPIGEDVKAAMDEVASAVATASLIP